MKKPFNYKETDPLRRCGVCNQPLKKNLLAKKPAASMCHTCYKLKSGSTNFNRAKYKAKQVKLINTHR
jgi:hypothetical protein